MILTNGFCKKITFCFISLISMSAQQAYSAAYHMFTNIAYDNPATLNTIKDTEAILGLSYLNGKFHFKGSNGPLTGSTTSDESFYIPYGRYAKRINDKLVLGLDVTSYQAANIQYPLGSLLSSLSTATELKTYDLSPRLSYQITSQVAIGIGFLADRMYSSALNFVVPPYELKNNGENWAYGWTAGISAAIQPMTFLNLSYTSALNHWIHGPSSWGPLHNNNYSTNAPVPAVYSINLTHIYIPKWVFSATLRYVQWNILQVLHVKNTVLGTFNFPLKYNNSWFGQLASHYQINDQWGLGGTAIYETSPQGTLYRPVGLPTYSQFTLGIGPDYSINKSFSIKLLYGHAWSNPPINTQGPLGPVNGRVNINGNLLDLSLNFHV